jgi:hypothetical protein
MKSCVYEQAGPVRGAVRRTAATRPLAVLYGRIQQLDGAERDRQFARALAIYPGFERYRRWARRPIPVIRLEPR